MCCDYHLKFNLGTTLLYISNANCMKDSPQCWLISERTYSLTSSSWIQNKKRGTEQNTLTNTTPISTDCVCLLFIVSIFRLSPVVRLEHWPSCLALLCLPWLHLGPSLPATWTGIRTHTTHREACSALIHQTETRCSTWTKDKVKVRS